MKIGACNSQIHNKSFKKLPDITECTFLEEYQSAGTFLSDLAPPCLVRHAI